MNTPLSSQTYIIGGMDCANCAREVETGVRKLDGVRSASVDFATCKLKLEGDVPFAALQARIEALGKTVTTVDQARSSLTRRGGVIGFWDYLASRAETRLALFGGATVIVTALIDAVWHGHGPLTAVLYIIGMVVTLLPIARSGLNTLLINREFNINLLMTIAAVGAIILGEYLEGATVIFLFAIGEALEGYTADRARQSIRGLLDLKPSQAIRIADGAEQTVPVAELRIGEIILVKPGEVIPMDGRVRAGLSSVNQAPITGESNPVAKAVDENVFAGSINGEGALTIEVTQLAADNTLSRIITLVEEAQSVRAPSQRLIDRFAHYYTPAVVVAAALVAILLPLLLNMPLFDSATGHGSLYRALSMLVIACPCALVISTPVTVISAITAAARRGVLIKGGAHLEALGTIRAIAFDKTGTLTEGKPVLTRVRAIGHLADHGAEGEPACAECDSVLALADAVERRTVHPLAWGVAQAAARRGVATAYPAADAVEILTGRGVRGMVNGQRVTVGSHTLFEDEYPHGESVCREVAEMEARGQTAMLIAQGAAIQGVVALADVPRANSAAVIRDLNSMGVQTVMLTGDNATVARAVGDLVGVSDVRAGLLPADKVSAVQGLLRQYGSVAMIGDGINDTPALAVATVGIAMGGAGSAQALETADIALLADDLAQLPVAIRMARLARRLIRENVILSFGIKAVFIVLALMGLTSLWVAILADVGMSLLVTLNGMRPLKAG